jgi:hypothetical protein
VAVFCADNIGEKQNSRKIKNNLFMISGRFYLGNGIEYIFNYKAV